jgi:hypothetical protein
VDAAPEWAGMIGGWAHACAMWLLCVWMRVCHGSNISWGHRDRSSEENLKRIYCSLCKDEPIDIYMRGCS